MEARVGEPYVEEEGEDMGKSALHYTRYQLFNILTFH
jgi:hypothetical protein